LTDEANKSRRRLDRAVRRKRAHIEQYLAARVANPDDARELAQEAFMRLLRLENAEFIQQPEAYLFRIAVNLAYEHGLRQKASPIDAYAVVEDDHEALATSRTTEELAMLRQRIEHLEAALGTMPPNVQAALVYQRRDGMTYAEIAQRLGVSTSMVKKYLHAALIRCRECMRDGNDGDTR